MPIRLVTYETAADVLSVSLSTVKRLVGTGAIKAVHVGSKPRIRVADLDAYVAGLGATDYDPTLQPADAS